MLRINGSTRAHQAKLWGRLSLGLDLESGRRRGTVFIVCNARSSEPTLTKDGKQLNCFSITQETSNQLG
ncbi:hypothetical protein V8C34DRAFT_293589 [Trichoderma compactum]